ncbi:MAG: hypothetical protein AAGC85_03905 [Bacteroidota bacterium]
MKKAFILLAITAFLISCQDNDPTLTPQIDGDLIEYIQRFEEEATKRGLSYDMSTLDAVFVDEVQRNGANFCGWGYSNYGPTNRPRIEIVRDCWSNKSDLQKEQFFFHEIGHAILKRPYDESLLPNKAYKSLMCGTCNQFNVYTRFFRYKREYYISELMSSLTPIPEWGEAKTNYVLFFEDLLQDEIKWFSSSTGLRSYESFIDSTGDLANPIRLGLSSNNQVNNSDFAFWNREFRNPTIKDGASVKLKVTISTDNVRGDGVAIALRGDYGGGPDSELVFFETTQGSKPLIGTVSNLIFEVNLPNYSQDTDELIIFLILLPNSSGIVYFDDISLETAID